MEEPLVTMDGNSGHVDTPQHFQAMSNVFVDMAAAPTAVRSGGVIPKSLITEWPDVVGSPIFMRL